jgi:hypothetical protein
MGHLLPPGLIETVEEKEREKSKTKTSKVENVEEMTNNF